MGQIIDLYGGDRARLLPSFATELAEQSNIVAFKSTREGSSSRNSTQYTMPEQPARSASPVSPWDDTPMTDDEYRQVEEWDDRWLRPLTWSLIALGLILFWGAVVFASLHA